MFQKRSQTNPTMLQCYNNVTTMLQQSCYYFISVRNQRILVHFSVEECYNNVTTMLQQCYNNVPTMRQRAPYQFHFRNHFSRPVDLWRDASSSRSTWWSPVRGALPHSRGSAESKGRLAQVPARLRSPQSFKGSEGILGGQAGGRGQESSHPRGWRKVVGST
jgi:hypothetical protein